MSWTMRSLMGCSKTSAQCAHAWSAGLAPDGAYMVVESSSQRLPMFDTAHHAWHSVTSTPTRTGRYRRCARWHRHTGCGGAVPFVLAPSMPPGSEADMLVLAPSAPPSYDNDVLVLAPPAAGQGNACAHVC